MYKKIETKVKLKGLNLLTMASFLNSATGMKGFNEFSFQKRREIDMT